MATTVTRRSTNPVADMLEWLDSGAPWASRGFGLTSYVRVEDYVDEGTYVVRAELPGIDPDKDVSLSIENGMLTIRGERREEEREKNRHELHYGSFTRTIPLPRETSPDEVTASYTDGVLEVRVPRAAAQSEAVSIPVSHEKG